MQIEHYYKYINNFRIPCIEFLPKRSQAMLLILHGIGGSKEEQLGLGMRLADKAFSVCLVDLPGHGENTNLFPSDIMSYVNSLIADYRNYYENIVAMGHSVGGRIALISDADYFIGISPTLCKDFSDATKTTIKNMRYHRVNLSSENALWDLQKELKSYDTARLPNTQIIYGSRDVPEIITACNNLKNENTSVISIENALHSDIFLSEETFKLIEKQLNDWFSKK